MNGDRGPKWRWVGGALISVLLFWWLRIPLLAEPGVERGWNSDHAIYGLMAQRIRDGGRLPFFFWGQEYLGPMTPVLTAGISYARRSPTCEPFDLRLAAFLQYCMGLLAWGAGLRLLFGSPVSVGAMVLLSIGPGFFLGANPQPETLLFCGGLLFWFGSRLVRSTDETRPRQLLYLGLASGFLWWMHPGVIFVTGPVLVLLALRSDWYPPIREGLAPASRGRFSATALGWAPPGPLALAAHFVQAYCGLRILSFFTSPFTGIGVPGLIWHESLAEPLLLLGLVHVGMAIPGIRPASAWQRLLPALAWMLPFAGGFAIGHAPPLVGRLLDTYEPSYSFDAALIPDAFTLSRIGTFLGRDLLPFTSGSSSIAAHVFAWGLVLGFVLAGIRRRSRIPAILLLRPGVAGGAALAAGVILLSFHFFLIRPRSPGQVHYLALALPALLGLAAEGLRDARPSRRATCLLPVLVAACGVLALQEGFRTARAAILAEPDPHVLIQSIRGAGYSVCYANYWIAYKYQFLSRETVRFIPYHSQDRNPGESRALRSSPGPRCLVLENGTVREFLPEDERNQGGPARRRRSPAAP